MIQLVNRAKTLTPKSRQRVYYTDFDRNFDRNPVTGNLAILQNEDSIRQAIENLILTNKGSRFYHSDVGGDIDHLLFQPVDDVTSGSLKQAIDLCLRYDPRAGMLSVSVRPYPAQNYYDVTVAFTDVNNQPTSYTFPLVARVR